MRPLGGGSRREKERRAQRPICKRLGHGVWVALGASNPIVSLRRALRKRDCCAPNVPLRRSMAFSGRSAGSDASR